MSSSTVSIVVSIGVINWLVFESILTKSRSKNGYKVYSAPMGLKILSFVAIPLFIYGAIANNVRNPAERWISAILLLFAILGIAFFPATILLSPEKVVSIFWFGLRRVKMQWSEVEAIYSNPENRSIIIQDKNQHRIVHTVLNVDRAGFIAELRKISTASKRITFQL
jgi:hypothetical protein